MRWVAAVFAAAVVTLGAVVVLANDDKDIPLLSKTNDIRGDANKLKDRIERERKPLPRPPCAAGVPKCASVSGRVVYVERVDPDGDGDLHVVVTGGSVTTPGLTAIDVRPGLRPARDPRIGDRAAASGPVQTGSHDQSQIHALNFRVLSR